MKVIVTCGGDNVDAATLVFKTLRVGFPTADVLVYDNCLDDSAAGKKVREICKLNNYNCQSNVFTTNDWSLKLTIPKKIDDSLVFVDSDMVFWESVENFVPQQLIAGRLIPRHVCQYTRLVTEARLHPSLLFIRNGKELAEALPQTLSKFAPIDYISPFVFTHNNRQIFYDTACNLYQTIGGQKFDKEMLNKYDHLFCSTFVDDVSKHTPELAHLKQLHTEVYKDHTKLKGAWQEQDRYFNKHSL